MLHPILAQVPEGVDADVAPTYYVTFLTAPDDDLDHLGAEITHRFDGVRDALEVISWAQEHAPATRLLLAEVTASRRGEDSRHRIRLWVNQPDRPWAREYGPDYTY